MTLIPTVEVEQNIIGCALYDPDGCSVAFETLRPEHFSEPLHRAVWDWIIAQRAQGIVCDATLVHNRLAGGEPYTTFGGQTYLRQMVEGASLLPLRGQVEVLIDASIRRSVHEIAEEAKTRDASGSDTLTWLERRASEIARQSGAGLGGVAVGLDALENLEAAWAGKFRGLSTGFSCLDRITGGLQPDDVWVFGGRTSMGKSVVLPCLTRGIAEQGQGVLLFSLEMSRRAVQARMIADISYERGLTPYGGDGGNVEFADLLNGRGTVQQREKARDSARKLSSLPVVVDDRGGHTLDQIISLSRRQVRAWERAKVEPGAIVIDHLGLVQSSIARDSKSAERADVMDRLKDAARQIGVPIIGAAQVNRGPENRDEKRPTMGDLNWSGSIEQIADFVGLLYRDAYYKERSSNEEDQMKAIGLRNEMEIIVSKNRSGPTCTVKAHIEVACSALRDEEVSDARRFG